MWLNSKNNWNFYILFKINIDYVGIPVAYSQLFYINNISPENNKQAFFIKNSIVSKYYGMNHYVYMKKNVLLIICISEFAEFSPRSQRLRPV